MSGSNVLNAVVNPEGIYLMVDDRPLILLDGAEAGKLIALPQDAMKMHAERFAAWGGVSEKVQ